MYCTYDRNRSTMSDACNAAAAGAAFPFHMGAVFDAARRGERLPATDVKEDETRYVIRMNMPGVDKEHVTIACDENGLTVATKADERTDDVSLRTVYRERAAGTYRRQFRFAERVDVQQTVARMENGVLELTIPKKVEEAKTIHVD